MKTFNLELRNGQTIEVVANKIENGFALHRTIDSAGQQTEAPFWSVTHIGTGLGVIDYVSGFKIARHILADVVATGVDGTLTTLSTEDKDQLRPIYREYAEYRARFI